EPQYTVVDRGIDDLAELDDQSGLTGIEETRRRLRHDRCLTWARRAFKAAGNGPRGNSGNLNDRRNMDLRGAFPKQALKRCDRSLVQEDFMLKKLALTSAMAMVLAAPVMAQTTAPS